MLIWLLLALAPLSAVGVLAVRNPGNRSQTRPDHPEPALRTRRYRCGDVAAFRQSIEAVVATRTTYGRSWRLAGTTPTPDGGFAVRAEVPVLFYTDDLEVRVQPDPTGAYWLVDVTSRSRVGKSDLGENRRHVVQLLNSLDAEMER
ncbi:MAG: DUF1499 domain-containing protein [Cytophagales bacterium]|nr:DUF1499 domain-containing protein [Cytophagales bacterium]